jgi:SAM-dependent methyltransferase
MPDYRAANLAMWNERAPAHAASPGYGFDRFVSNPAHLSHVVSFDVPRLGDLTGLNGVHLQCHIGTDTVSLSRLGAHMTGLDFSPAALAEARRLSDATGAGIDFVQSDVYDAVNALGGRTFDLVFTGIGALCWLPDVRRWADVVAALLAPGGRLFVREGHPMLWTLDESDATTLLVAGPYFERQDDPWIDDSDDSYVATDGEFAHTVNYTFNHGIGEVVTALLDVGLVLTMLVEHDSVPWNALPGQMQEGPDGEWRLVDRPARLAATYTLQAVKPD